ncbi:YjbF family lipoprotein [Jannaschia sp. 2305UL9-9]|uniref:YjbF family lipoprotein n=1 Tax=Jannaschia sp. 2305UL9-9 TaxID=3121638 RepID=UPI00352938C0
MLMRIARPVCLALSIALVAACSGGTNVEQQSDGGVAKLAAVRLLSIIPGRASAPATPDARQVLTPELLNGSSTPVLLVVLQEANTAFTMIPTAVNFGTEQWRDSGSGAFLRRNGILVGTRGLGFDLLTADVAGLSQALRQGGGEDVLRVNRVLNGQDQVVAMRYLCRVIPVGRETLDFYGARHGTTIYDEVCEGSGAPFVNRYWVDSSGTVRRALEQVTETFGQVEISLLRD